MQNYNSAEITFNSQTIDKQIDWRKLLLRNNILNLQSLLLLLLLSLLIKSILYKDNS